MPNKNKFGYPNWRRLPDKEIEAFISQYEGLESTQYDDDLIQQLDDMEQELADREEWRSEKQAEYYDQYPSLQDSGLELGSYET